MTTVLLLIHLFVTIALIGVILIQRSEGGGLGIGTAQGMGSFMTGRGTAGAGGTVLAPAPTAPAAPGIPATPQPATNAPKLPAVPTQ